MKNDKLNIKNCVYVVRCPAHQKGLYKIGYTTNLKNRLYDFNTRTSTPLPYEIVAVIQTKKCKAFEEFLHEKFADKRLNPNREFFSFCDSKGRDCIKTVLSKITTYSENFSGKCYKKDYFYCK